MKFALELVGLGGFSSIYLLNKRLEGWVVYIVLFIILTFDFSLENLSWYIHQWFWVINKFSQSSQGSVNLVCSILQ